MWTSYNAPSILEAFTLNEGEGVSGSVVSDPCDPMDCMYPSRLLCPWNSPGKNTGMGSPFLLQGIFQTQGSNPGLLYCRDSLLAEPPGKPFTQQSPLFPPVEHSQNDALTLHTHMWISIIKKLSLPSFSFFRKKKIYLSIFGCTGSLLLHSDFLYL